jgi:hypothetical protein
MGVLSHVESAVVLINRTKGAGKYERELNVRFDGEDIKLKPGENPGIPVIAAPFAKKQNILMGSRHPTNPLLYVSLVAVKERDNEDDCRYLTEEELAEAAQHLEAIDRSGQYYGEPMRQNVKLSRRAGFSPFEARVGMPDTGFAGGPTGDPRG